MSSLNVKGGALTVILILGTVFSGCNDSKGRRIGLVPSGPVPSQNTPPVIEPIADIVTDEDVTPEPVSIAVSDTEDDRDGKVVTLAVAADTGIFTAYLEMPNTLVVEPNLNENGTAMITVTATDSGGLSASREVTVQVLPVNDAPVVTIPDISFEEDTPYSMTLGSEHVQDPDNDIQELTWSATGNVQIEVQYSGSTMALIPASDWYGTEAVTMRAADPAGAWGEDLVTVEVVPINDPPGLGDIPDITFVEGDVVQGPALDTYLMDVDLPHDTHSYSVSGNVNVNVAIGEDTVVLYSSVPDWHGTETIYFTVEDSGGESATDEVVVTVESRNHPPYIDPPIPEIHMCMNNQYQRSMRQHANDDDPGDVLSWSAVIPENDIIESLTFLDDADMTLVIDPVHCHWGEITVTFVLSDQHGATDSQDVKIVVCH